MTRRLIGALCAAGVVLFAGGCVATSTPSTPTFDTHEQAETVEIMETSDITIENILVPGPGSAVSAHSLGSPNRVGSLEVPVRMYLPKQDPWVTLVWAHGGSFVHGTLDWPESDWVATRFAEAGVRVLAVDYILASDEVKAPAPANDVIAVARWASETVADPIVLGGGSAGAHLASLAAISLAECRIVQAETQPAEAAATDSAAKAPGVSPSGLLLLYPTLHRQQAANAQITALTQSLPDQRRFGAERITGMYDFYLGDALGEGDAEATVIADAACAQGYSIEPRVVGELHAETLSLLPPTVIVNADADDLRASGEQFATQLAQAGVAVTSHVQSGTVHGYMNRPHESTRAEKDAQHTIDRFVAGLHTMVDPAGSQFPPTIH